MTQLTMEERFSKATGVVCKQGMVQFPVSDTAIAIIIAVVGENTAELELICAFDDKPSQTLAQLVESSGFSEEKIVFAVNGAACLAMTVRRRRPP